MRPLRSLPGGKDIDAQEQRVALATEDVRHLTLCLDAAKVALRDEQAALAALRADRLEAEAAALGQKGAA